MSLNPTLLDDIRQYLADTEARNKTGFGESAAIALLKRVMADEGEPLVEASEITADAQVRPYDYPGSPSHIQSFDFRDWF